jgi:hypothetical protein
MEPASQIRFDFPFQPYPAQQLLMTALYETASYGTERAKDGLAGAAVGIFESPTGTGKSLSIICSLLKWLEEREQAMMNPQPKSQAKSASASALSNTASVDGFPDWLKTFTMESDSSKKARAMEFAHRIVTQRISAAKAASHREASTVSLLRLLVCCMARELDVVPLVWVNYSNASCCTMRRRRRLPALRQENSQQRKVRTT